MDAGHVLDIGRESMMLILKICLPILGIGLLVGLTIALLQALTQLQEMTLVFVPKIIAVFLGILFLMPYVGRQLSSFFEMLIDNIVKIS